MENKNERRSSAVINLFFIPELLLNINITECFTNKAENGLKLCPFRYRHGKNLFLPGCIEVANIKKPKKGDNNEESVN